LKKKRKKRILELCPTESYYILQVDFTEFGD